MSSVVNVVLPVFALILLGYLCRRSGRMGPTGASELNRFVVWLGLPALLFSVVATSTWEQLWQPGFIAAFAIGCLGVFAFTLAYRMLQKQPLVDASLDALGASYANTGYVGIPLCMLVLGDEALQPAMVASIVVVCVLFAIALACEPRVLLLDEPVAGVPAGEREELLQTVAALPAEVSVLLIEHDMDLVFEFADRITVLVNGAVLTEGTPEAIAADPQVKAVYLGHGEEVAHG